MPKEEIVEETHVQRNRRQIRPHYVIALVAFCALARDQAQAAQLFPHPTGNNALEEYVQAADMLNSGHFKIYQSWQPPEQRPTPEQAKAMAEERKKEFAALDPETQKQDRDQYGDPAPEEANLTNRLNSITLLDVRKEEVKQFEGALDLIAAGNRKPIYFPNTGDPADSFVWLADVRQVSKFVSDAALVAFSEGQPDRAVRILNVGLIMSHKIQTANLIGGLAGIGSTSIVLARFNLHLDCLSLDETRQIAALAEQLIQDTDSLKQMAHNEALLNAQMMEKMLADPPKDTVKDAGESGPIPFTPAQIAAVRQELPQALAARVDQAPVMFLRPEEDWLSLAGQEEQLSAPPPSSKPHQLATYLASMVTSPTDRQATLAILKSRAQLRLLRLHALIREYRWQNGSYPESLENMKLPHEDTYDPLSRKSFQYSLKDGAYRLFSEGVPETGVIELKYRMKSGGPAARDDGVINP